VAKILVLGAGAMGSAFCFPAADAGNDVLLVGTHLDSEWIHSVCETGVHPKLKMKFPEKVSPFTHDQLGTELKTCDLIVREFRRHSLGSGTTRDAYTGHHANSSADQGASGSRKYAADFA